MTGFIQLHRQIWDNPISRKPNYIAVWLYLISNANYKDKYVILNNKKVTIKRGSFLGSISNISLHFNLTRSTIKRIIDYFEGDEMLYTQRTPNYTVFTIKNYDQYQVAVHQRNTDDTRTEQRSATTNKDNKGIKKKKNIIDCPDGVALHVWDDFITHRKTKKAELTQTALNGIINQAEKAGWGLEDALSEICQRGWTGFKAEWVNKKGSRNYGDNGKSAAEIAAEVAKEYYVE